MELNLGTSAACAIQLSADPLGGLDCAGLLPWYLGERSHGQVQGHGAPGGFGRVEDDPKQV